VVTLGGTRSVGSRSLAVATLLLKAAGAIHRLVATRLERHPGDTAALGTLRLKHLAGLAIVAATAVVVPTATATATLALPRGATLRTASGLVGKAFLREELLLPSREREGGAAVAAGQDPVGVARVTHDDLPRTEKESARSGVTLEEQHFRAALVGTLGTTKQYFTSWQPTGTILGTFAAGSSGSTSWYRDWELVGHLSRSWVFDDRPRVPAAVAPRSPDLRAMAMVGSIDPLVGHTVIAWIGVGSGAILRR
jgi:hypothetical protein